MNMRCLDLFTTLELFRYQSVDKEPIQYIKIYLARLAQDRSQPLVYTPILILEALNIKFPWFIQKNKRQLSFTFTILKS